VAHIGGVDLVHGHVCIVRDPRRAEWVQGTVVHLRLSNSDPLLVHHPHQFVPFRRPCSGSSVLTIMSSLRVNLDMG
jgi:hypothetical protein